MRLASLSLLLLALCATAGPVRAEPTVVRELHFGEALFLFYQEQHFEAITRIQAGRLSGHIRSHDDEAELLLGGMLLAWGQHEEATRIFRRLLAQSARPELRDRAWLQLARVSWERGALDQATEALAAIGGTLTPGQAAERRLLEAQVLMAAGRYQQAADRLEAWEGPADWRAYAGYNLGVALLRQGRFEEGVRELDRVGSPAAPTPELRALADRANVALGFALLQHEAPGEAREVLRRVRLNGPHSAEALLGFGWAESALGRHREALTPWLALRERDLLQPAVQESLLAVPYAFASLDAPGQAAEAYLQAIADLQAEIARLESAIVEVQSGALLPAILSLDDSQVLGWQWRLEAVPDRLESRYLYRLMAGHEFQEGLKNYRDLEFLSGVMQRWQDSLGAFADMVATGELAWAEREPRAQALMSRSDVDELLTRHRRLGEVLAGVVADHDTLALRRDEETMYLEELDEIAARLAALDAGLDPEVADLRDRERLLRGVMLWQLNAEFPARAWDQRRVLRDLLPILQEMHAREARILALLESSPERFEGQAERIAALGPRVAALSQQVTQASVRQRGHLEGLAVASLQAQVGRLRSHEVQARFALARIYDRAAALREDLAAIGRDGRR